MGESEPADSEGCLNLAKTIDDIEAEIAEVLAERRLPPGVQISAKTQIARDLGLDFVAIMDFVMDIEDRFDISIPLIASRKWKQWAISAGPSRRF